MVWQEVGNAAAHALIARAKDADGVPAITDPWPTKDIVYVAIVGTVMLAALLEWFLWLAAFLYCLVKVFQKAENMSVRILAIIMMVLFTAFRAIFLPIMVVTLPLPSQVTKYFPQTMVSFLQWFAFWSFAGLLTVPWLFCVYQLVTHSVGRTKRIKTVLDEASAPKVVIVMPCYKEIPEILLRTVDSLVDCDYPPSCLHIFLSFDGDQEDELYLNTIEKLGVPLTLDSYPKSIDVTYRSCRITVSRFPHGGKRHCQKRTYRLIDKIYAEYLKRNDNLFVLFIDSDCILDKVCIQNFVYEMELKPGSKKNMLAMTGVITSTTEKNSLITIIQDMEYIHGQLFERSVESGCGAVTCLPGALTILRFSAFRRMAKYYFADKAEQCDDLFDYGKCHLGEDRWLTHLFMIGAKERYQIQMNTGAFCKTEAVQTYQSLLKQRRRWFLGFITNEVCMLTDIRLWKRYPLLCIVRFMQNTIRTTALLFFIMVISIITTSQKVKNLPVGFIAISLGLNWILMLYFGAKLGRYKIMLYPIMFVINPFFNWLYMVYGIFTAGQRTWGGPRADAGAATATTTPQQAIEQAEATGDDLNVVPETFKAAVENQKHRPAPVPLQPLDHIEGRFAPAERLPGGWYQQGNDSGLHLPNMLPRDPNVPGVPLHPRSSMDSFVSGTSAGNSVYLPRRVESFMDPEDARIYHKQQATQRPAGGAYFEAERQFGEPYQVSTGQNKSPYQESVNSLSDDSVYQGHSKLPQRPPHSRGNSDNSVSTGHRTPQQNSPLATEFGLSGLEVPKASHMANNARTGRSPLARQSFVRTAPEGELGIEMQHQQQQRSLLRDVSPAPVQGSDIPSGPSHERSESRDSEKKRRRRLTKNPPK
ncbi:chitin synthase D [Lophiotrema nucula]|uniref:chitin synthase n=1 Tax=Lophiotrema nucula TaxID=690887 RepID=A0A6A5YUV2_9PLEO|nr:chitin synthase D [Lophiotrema nucula]